MLLSFLESYRNLYSYKILFNNEECFAISESIDYPDGEITFEKLKMLLIFADESDFREAFDYYRLGKDIPEAILDRGEKIKHRLYVEFDS